MRRSGWPSSRRGTAWRASPSSTTPAARSARRYGVMHTPEPASGHGGQTEPAILVLRPNRTVVAASYTIGSTGRMPLDDALRAARRIADEE